MEDIDDVFIYYYFLCLSLGMEGFFLPGTEGFLGFWGACYDYFLVVLSLFRVFLDTLLFVFWSNSANIDDLIYYSIFDSF